MNDAQQPADRHPLHALDQILLAAFIRRGGTAAEYAALPAEPRQRFMVETAGAVLAGLRWVSVHESESGQDEVCDALEYWIAALEAGLKAKTPVIQRCEVEGCGEEAVIRVQDVGRCWPHALQRANQVRAAANMPPLTESPGGFVF